MSTCHTTIYRTKRISNERLNTKHVY